MPPVTSDEIAARLDRLPASRTVWTILVLVSLGGVFEFYDLFFTAYVAPGMVATGLFTPDSLGVFSALKAVRVAGVGTFVFSTFAGLWFRVVTVGAGGGALRPQVRVHGVAALVRRLHGALYPTRIRSRAVGFVYSWSRLAAAFAGLIVGSLLAEGGVPAVAAFIGGAMLLGIGVIAVWGPSTNGLALEQLSE